MAAVPAGPGLGLSWFPDSVLLQILSYLPVKDLVRSGRVCKRWRRLVLDKTLWKDVDLMPYKITSKILWHLIRHYLSKSLRSLKIKGLLQSAKKLDLLTPALLQALAKQCPNLRRLRLRETDLRALGYETLPSSLKILELSHCEIPFAWFQATAAHNVSLPQLEHLALCNVPAFSNRDLEAVCQGNQLKTLILSGTYRVTTKGLQLAASRLAQVEHLTLHMCNITNAALLLIAKNLKSLRHLDLTQFYYLTDADLSYLTSLKTLEHLDLQQCGQISPHAVVALCAALPALKHLNLNGLVFNDQGISQIRESLPDCVITNDLVDLSSRLNFQF